MNIYICRFREVTFKQEQRKNLYIEQRVYSDHFNKVSLKVSNVMCTTTTMCVAMIYYQLLVVENPLVHERGILGNSAL